MKKEKVKSLLYDARGKIIDELDEMKEYPGEAFVKNHGMKEYDFDYGYRVGISSAAMILLNVIYELFPEEKDEDEYEE